MKKFVFIFYFLIPNLIFAQNVLRGLVQEQTNVGNAQPLVGANIIWKGTSIGTTSDLEGKFQIPLTESSNILIVSFIGYKSETFTITNEKEIKVTLIPEASQISDVEVVEKTPSTEIDYLGVENSSTLTGKELQKAACCTLAESFETNPSIDISFTDAITGLRQIEMLGLAGTYTQTTLEALPYIRGLISNTGLSFIPGTWIEAINISKGVGSVANGYESITGQIDIDMQKPFTVEDAKPLFLNFYGNNEQHLEGNLNYRYKINDKLSSITLLNASSKNHQSDRNSDSFMDMPTSQTYNIMQRWQYRSGFGLLSQLGFQIVSDKQNGGTISSLSNSLNSYRFNSHNKFINIYGKTGYIFADNNQKSIGLQWSYNHYNNSANYGTRNYGGKEKNLYLNFIYQSPVINESNILRTGVSFVYDELRENFISQNYNRTEKVPGAFVEYTFKPNFKFSVVAGLRGDFHNEFGFFMTPRLHIRYSPDPDWVLRAAVGRGYRTSNIFTEYASSFASSREINILKSNNFGYGLDQESAWNYGFNLTHYFLFNYQDGTLSFDFYRTNFDKATIANLDSNPQTVTFSSVSNGAFSNTFQAELNIGLYSSLTTRLAYKFIDAKQLINRQWLEKPFTAKHRALVNIAYQSEKVNEDDAQMSYDFTIQWFGQKRIPSTVSNPVEFQTRENSPSFILVNSQITRSFNNLFDLYLGVENLFDFRQNNPIIDSENPNRKYFDASLIWGPIVGRTLYAGLRFKI